MAEETAEYSFNSAIRGYHVYREVWTSHHRQRLVGEREHGNAEDRSAVAVTERDRPRPGGALGEEDVTYRGTFTVNVHIDVSAVFVVVRNRSIFVSDTGGKTALIYSNTTRA